MILIVLALLCVLTVPLRGGRLARLADLRLRGLWLPMLALPIVLNVRGAGGFTFSIFEASAPGDA